MSATSDVGLTRADLDDFPDDGLRRELIDGRLYVSPRPRSRHQRVMVELAIALGLYGRVHGGTAIVDFNNDYSPTTHLEPDGAFVLAEHPERLTEMGIEGPPDVVVEISSPSTRGHDLVSKRAVYERERVTEFWFLDLDHDQVLVFTLVDGEYGEPRVVGRGETLTSEVLPGFSTPVDELLLVPPG